MYNNVDKCGCWHPTKTLSISYLNKVFIKQLQCDEFTTIMEEVAETKLGKSKKIKEQWITTELIKKCDDR